MRKLALLLRAVNVGGRKLAMAAFREGLEDAGFAGAETLLASGNAVVTSGASKAAVEAQVEALLAERFGLPTQVLARDADELAAVIAACAFPAMARDEPSRLAVFFLRGEPAAELAALGRYCTAGEAVAAGPGCLYIAYPAGMGTSKLGIGPIERTLKIKGTARNWNTVGKVLARL